MPQEKAETSEHVVEVLSLAPKNLSVIVLEMSKPGKCLLCFLDDDLHADLRAQAQSHSKRHERALRAYQKVFVEEFHQLCPVGKCPHHGGAPEQLQWWVDQLTVSVQKLNASDILERLILAYESWICGRTSDGASLLDKLLKEFGFEKRPTKKLDKVLLFRGRTGDRVRDELFHISFSDRHCISNQRYSLAGQPLLYLGLSILDCVCELRGDPLAFPDFSFCYFWLMEPDKVRVLDTSNELRDLILNNLLPIVKAGLDVRGISNDQPSFAPTNAVYSDAFITFLVSSLCSFKRKEVSAQDKFAPEYVLPQLMAEWARCNGFDGILYSSTRIDTKGWRMDGDLQLNRYRENVAFFTNFNPSSNDEHDLPLLNRFEISQTTTLARAAAITDRDLEALKNQIVTKTKAASLTELAQKAGIDIDNAFKDIVHIDSASRKIPYSQTDCGKVQRHLQFEFMRKRAGL